MYTNNYTMPYQQNDERIILPLLFASAASPLFYGGFGRPGFGYGFGFGRPGFGYGFGRPGFGFGRPGFGFGFGRPGFGFGRPGFGYGFGPFGY